MPGGKGGGSGPVDYLLGRERNREGARVLRGAPEEVRELIDATPFAKKYTSGVLSFAEQTLPPGERERVMESFERVLMPGLEKNQYSILWVEHRDKGRLELNFVIPNMELASGKRLQPYYDRADRPRINALADTGESPLRAARPERTGEQADTCHPRIICRKRNRRPQKRLRGDWRLFTMPER
ncbi:relaxase/mobilization nuclease domain-containing protein [Escherichia coli]|nr:relaxase/mobilization nuclease domain-containing protein [Escherichia coli]